jgi:hypothetical protein
MSATTDVIVHHFHDLRGFHHEVLDSWAEDTDGGGQGGGVGGTSVMAVLLPNVAHDDGGARHVQRLPGTVRSLLFAVCSLPYEAEHTRARLTPTERHPTYQGRCSRCR